MTRMKLFFLVYLGDYSYSFQRCSGLISITVTIFLFFSIRMQLQEIIEGFLKNLLQLQLHDLIVFVLKCNLFEKSGMLVFWQLAGQGANTPARRKTWL